MLGPLVWGPWCPVSGNPPLVKNCRSSKHEEVHFESFSNRHISLEWLACGWLATHTTYVCTYVRTYAHDVKYERFIAKWKNTPFELVQGRSIVIFKAKTYSKGCHRELAKICEIRINIDVYSFVWENYELPFHLPLRLCIQNASFSEILSYLLERYKQASVPNADGGLACVHV